MKKIKLLVFALVLTLGVGMLVGCNKKANVTATKLEEKEIISFAVLTSARLGSQVVGGNYLHSSNDHSFDQNSIDEVDNYFNVLEYYLSGGNIANPVLESDYLDENGNKVYDHMIKYNVPSKDGNVSYVFHYNEVLKEEEEIDDEDGECEQEFEITELCYLDDVVWMLLVKEIETEEDELEISYWFYSKIDSDNYVEMKYEKDVESKEHEEKFFIKVVKDGVTKESEIKVELEDDKVEIELEFKKNGVKYELKLKPTTKDGYNYVIEFEVDGDKDRDGKIYIKIENNVYTYKVVEGSQTYEFTVDKNVADDTTNPDGNPNPAE